MKIAGPKAGSLADTAVSFCFNYNCIGQSRPEHSFSHGIMISFLIIIIIIINNTNDFDSNSKKKKEKKRASLFFFCVILTNFHKVIKVFFHIFLFKLSNNFNSIPIIQSHNFNQIKTFFFLYILSSPCSFIIITTFSFFFFFPLNI